MRGVGLVLVVRRIQKKRRESETSDELQPYRTKIR